MKNFSNSTRIAIALAGIGTAVLAGCSSTDSMPGMSGDATPAASGPSQSAAADSSASAANATFNDTDVEFVTMMYPHHAQAIAMADVVEGKDASPEVVALADGIRAAQQPEMDAFTRLLSEWGQPAPDSMAGHDMPGMDMPGMDMPGMDMPGMDMPGMDMPGMMTDEQMAMLDELTGPDFDREWLTMMIEHHRGAIAMSDDELASGVNEEARQLAEQIRAGQQAEIEQMESLLQQ